MKLVWQITASEDSSACHRLCRHFASQAVSKPISFTSFPGGHSCYSIELIANRVPVTAHTGVAPWTSDMHDIWG